MSEIIQALNLSLHRYKRFVFLLWAIFIHYFLLHFAINIIEVTDSYSLVKQILILIAEVSLYWENLINHLIVSNQAGPSFQNLKS